MTPPTAQRKTTDTRHKADSRIAPNFPKNSTKKERAAILLAEDYLSDEAIAEEVGVTKRTITNWKQDADFAALVGDYHGKIVAQALRLRIAKTHERVKVLDDLHSKALEAIAHRVHMAEQDDSPMSHASRVFGDHMAPEAITGLFTAKQSVSASGKVVTDWVFDNALVKEIRELQKQAAQDLGQWTDQSRVEVDGIEPPVIQIFGVTDEDMP